jgi:hypothetical protein
MQRVRKPQSGASGSPGRSETPGPRRLPAGAPHWHAGVQLVPHCSRGRPSRGSLVPGSSHRPMETRILLAGPGACGRPAFPPAPYGAPALYGRFRSPTHPGAGRIALFLHSPMPTPADSDSRRRLHPPVASPLVALAVAAGTRVYARLETLSFLTRLLFFGVRCQCRSQFSDGAGSPR